MSVVAYYRSVGPDPDPPLIRLSLESRLDDRSCVGVGELSVIVGVMRGHWTRMWRAADVRILKQGTKLTVGLFLGLIVVKFGMGTVSHFTGIDDGEDWER